MVNHRGEGLRATCSRNNGAKRWRKIGDAPFKRPTPELVSTFHSFALRKADGSNCETEKKDFSVRFVLIGCWRVKKKYDTRHYPNGEWKRSGLKGSARRLREANMSD